MRRRLFAATAVACVVVVSAVTGAAPASAFVIPGPRLIQEAKIWYQSFQRSSENAPCVAPAALDIAWQEDWPGSENQWTASWAQWPNGGTGGWVCNRQITWSPAQYSIPLD